jgi:hypothetical protein
MIWGGRSRAVGVVSRARVYVSEIVSVVDDERLRSVTPAVVCGAMFGLVPVVGRVYSAVADVAS